MENYYPYNDDAEIDCEDEYYRLVRLEIEFLESLLQEHE